MEENDRQIKTRINKLIDGMFKVPRMHAFHLETFEFQTITLLSLLSEDTHYDLYMVWHVFLGTKGYHCGSWHFHTWLEKQPQLTEDERWSLLTSLLQEFVILTRGPFLQKSLDSNQEP
jgi:hypothetical protein